MPKCKLWLTVGVLAACLCLSYAQNVDTTTQTAPTVPPVTHEPDNASKLPFAPAFASAFAMIIVSEIGDRTFFIAAIMAMSNPRRLIFLSAIAALILMTVLSVLMGMTLPRLLSPEYTQLASCVLYLAFSAKIFYSAFTSDDDGDEFDEVQKELHEVSAKRIEPDGSVEMQQISTEESDVESSLPVPQQTVGEVEDQDIKDMEKLQTDSHWLSPRRCFSPVAIQCFIMTFLGEWGDRSQITTIAMSASQNAFGVGLGSIIAHSLCTALAVIGGKFLASRISERTIGFVSGALFLFFGIQGLMQAYTEGLLRMPTMVTSKTSSSMFSYGPAN